MRSPCFLLFSVVAAIGGCTSTPDTPMGDADLATGGDVDLAAAPDGTGQPGADLTQPAAKCKGLPAATSGTTTRTVHSGGQDRTYLLHVPAGYDPSKPTPVVLNLHGFTDTAAHQVAYTNMTPQSESRNFLMAAPQGVGGALAGWNAGSCCGIASGEKIDDVGFMRDLLSDLRQSFCVDDDRVYAAGFSNGAFFANRLGCELADQIAAIGPVSGGLLLSDCHPARPVPMIYFHGTSDPVVPYNGGGLPGGPSAMANWTAWAMRDGCTDMPTETYNKGAARCQTYHTCSNAGEVTLCTITGGVHAWPGAQGANMDIDATTQILDFFTHHPR